MRRFIFPLLLVATATSLANAGLILSAIYDGSGSTPKGIEVYVESTGSYAGWTADIESNANTTFGIAYTFDATVYSAGDFIYITSTSTDPCFASTANVIADGSFNMNGDDRVRLTDGTNVIDQYGVSATDGTGTAWEYTDSYAVRNDNTTASGGFVIGDWTIAPINTLDPGNAPLVAVKGTYVAPVPEPAGLALAFLAAFGLMGFRRK